MEVIIGKFTIYNVAMTTAGTEYSKQLPDGTKGFLIKLENVGYQLQVCVVEGESDTTYYNIAQGDSLRVDNAKAGTITLYFRTTANTQKAQIVVFK